MTMAINHFGHFYFTYLLWDLIKKSPEARILNVSSMVHFYATANFLEDLKCTNKPYDSMNQYSDSKLCNVIFTVGLEKLLQKSKLQNIKVASLHPGVVDSGFYNNRGDQSFLMKFFKNCCCCCFISN